jgi:hypothetical protein
MGENIEYKALLDTGNFDAGMDIMIGGLLKIGEVAVDAMMQAGGAVAGFVEDSFAGAMEAEQNMARTGNLIDNMAASYDEAAAEYEAASKQIVESTIMPEEELSKLQDEADKASAKLADMQEAYVKNTTPKELTVAQTQAIRDQERAISELQKQIAEGSQQQVVSEMTEAQLDKLRDKLELASAKLADMQTKYASLENPTQAQTVALKQQQEAVDELTATIAAGSETKLTTVLSSKDLTTLQDKLEAAQQKLTDTNARIAESNQAGEATESQTLALKEQQTLVEDLNKKLSEGSQVVSQTMAQSLGMVAPKAVITKERVAELGNEFANLAGGSDDAILAIEEMAIRMGTISAEEMPDFIQTSLDLAAATGVDAAQGARLLAQAYDEPWAAMSRFEKQGINFTAAQKDQMKKFQEAGNAASGFALIMDQVGTATSGAAQAVADTAAGQFEILKGTISEAGEGIASAFLPVIQTLFDQIIAPNLPLITELSNQIAAAITAFISGQGPLQQFGADLQPIFTAVGELGSAFQETMPEITAATQQMATTVASLIKELGPELISSVASALTNIAEFWRQNGDGIIERATYLFEKLAQIFGGGLEIIGGVIQLATALMAGDWQSALDGLGQIAEGAWSIISGVFEFWINSILGYVGTDLEEFSQTWFSVFSNAQAIVDKIFGDIQKTIDGVLGGLQQRVSEVQGIIGGLTGGNISLPFSVPGLAPGGGNTSTNHATTNFNYSPTYGGQPPSPATDFNIMQVMFGD